MIGSRWPSVAELAAAHRDAARTARWAGDECLARLHDDQATRLEAAHRQAAVR